MKKLRPEQLYRRCDPELFDFETTRDLEALKGILGQPRAVAAVEFGIGIDREGYNIFAFGPTRVGKHQTVQRFLAERAEGREVPPDVCYVNNFEEPQKPRLLRLPAGQGRQLRGDLEGAVRELGTGLAAAFESEEYQTRRQVIEETFAQHQGKAVTELAEAAREKSIALLRTPMGIVFAPLQGEEVLSPEDFKTLSEEDQARFKAEMEQFQEELQKIFLQLPGWQREKRENLRVLGEEVSRLAVDPLFAELRQRYEGLAGVLAYLERVEKDVMENASALIGGSEQPAQEGVQLPGPTEGQEKRFERRYRVNLLVDHGESRGAPVVYEPHPTYQKLIGRIEHLSQMGNLVTDFNLVRGGALHLANGGYLLLDALKLLQNPFAWEALKRTLYAGQIRIDSPNEAVGLLSTYSLEPEAVPLKVKIVLLGEPRLYYLLASHDPDFGRLFKVAADFGEQLDRVPGNERSYARLIASLASEDELMPLDRGAVARIVEHGARFLGDSEKLSLELHRIRDLLREADYWAGKGGREVVTAADVQEAVDAQTFRSDRLRQRVQEQILRGTVLVATEGTAVGRVNGLSVLQLGDFAFGQPSRISARVRLGKGEVVNIEREVELSGAIHSKGVLILAGLLGARYARERPLALAASLVFEQSYGGVDGDSASSTELYALLSAIAELPIKQSLAVTGSINQQGEVQAIGGANEKIEGFYDVCRARGLTGDQGVLIPASNVKHLMLRSDVVAAVAAGEFSVYPVATVDEGIELLTGLPAGERDAAGNFPQGSVNFLVERCLQRFAEKARELAHPPPAAAGEDAGDGGEGP